MPKLPSEYPTELELRILKILWETSPLKVREVRKLLAEQGHDIAHTSVISMLNTMCDKGYLERYPQGNAFLFAPCVSREQIHSGMLHDLVERVFDGSAEALMLSLFERETLEDSELRRLRKLINQRLTGGE